MDRRSGLVLVAALVAAGALMIIVFAEPVPGPVDRGAPAPAFDLPRLAPAEDGSERLSLDAVRGRVVLLNFWASWCEPCEAEMPSMERLYRSLAGEEFELVAISVDDDRSEVEEFQARYGLSFPILLDPDKAVSQRYQTFRYPESFLIGRDGRVVARYIGPRDWDASEYPARIRRLLEAEDAASADPR